MFDNNVMYLKHALIGALGVGGIAGFWLYMRRKISQYDAPVIAQDIPNIVQSVDPGDVPNLDVQNTPAESQIFVGAPTGIRNNNPGNIRYDGTKWIGLAYPPADGRGYAIFSSMAYGVRAMAIAVQNSARLHGNDTVREIITRWAPPTENDTNAYVDDVAKQLAISPDAVLDFSTGLVPLLKAMIRHENGAKAAKLVSNFDIEKGVSLI